MPIRKHIKTYAKLISAGVIACAALIPVLTSQSSADASSAAAKLAITNATADATSAPGEIDTLSYFINTHGTQLSGTHALSQTTSGNTVYVVKWDSDAYEQYSYDANYIYLKQDHSGGATANGSYTFSDGRWMKRYMAVGDSISAGRNMEQYFNVGSGGCTQGTTSGYLPYVNTLIAHNPAMNFGGTLGVQDTIVLQYDYRWGFGSDYERDYYAKGYGLVEWQLFHNNQLAQTSIFNNVTQTSATPPNLGNTCDNTPANSPVSPLPTSLASFETSLYTCVLHYSTAVVGSSGYNFWLNDLEAKKVTVQGVITDFYEAQTGFSNTAFTDSLYDCVLYRTIDPTSEANAVAQLNKGTLTRPALVQAILASAEFKARILPILNSLT